MMPPIVVSIILVEEIQMIVLPNHHAQKKPQSSVGTDVASRKEESVFLQINVTILIL
jgi:hypothetical protein